MSAPSWYALILLCLGHLSLAKPQPQQPFYNPERVLSNAPDTTPPPSPFLSPALQKRKYISVCDKGQTTDCPQIGVDDILTEPNGGKYIPECDEDGKCHWIGIASVTVKITGKTTYEIVTTTTGLPYVVPFPIGAEPPPPPPPPPPPGDDIKTIEPTDEPTSEETTEKSTCTTSTSTGYTTVTSTITLAFNDARWDSIWNAEDSSTLEYDYQVGGFDFEWLTKSNNRVTAGPSCKLASTVTKNGGGTESYCQCGVTLAGLSTITTNDPTISLVCAVIPTQVISTYLKPSPACLTTGSPINTASVSYLINGFCSNEQRMYGSPVVEAAAAASYAEWQDIIDNLQPAKSVNAVYVTIITTRSGCKSATYDVDASKADCGAMFRSVAGKCTAKGGVMSEGCFDFGVTAINVPKG